jgi:glycosyltransferase involved in cell wall biosynthesis
MPTSSSGVAGKDPSRYDTRCAPEDVVDAPTPAASRPPATAGTAYFYSGWGGYFGYAGAYLSHPAVTSFAEPFVREEESAGEPLRMIHVGPNLVRGGAEQWLINLRRFLNPRRVRFVRAVATRPAVVDPQFVADLRAPVEVGQADAVRLAARECDVLLSWGEPLNEWLADCRPPLCVCVAHGEGEWNRRYLDGSSAVLDHVVAVSHSVKRRVCAMYPTSVIFNGIDAARLAQSRSREAARAALGFGPGDFVLGYVGRFSPEKRPQVVLEAAALLPPPFKAFLVGWGVQRHALEEFARKRLPGRHAFAVASDYLGDYYHAMDAVCLVSEEEGFPLVLLEAMMCGRPLIVTPVGCTPEVIKDRVNGVVVGGDPASVAAASELLQRHPEWARGVAAEGRAFAERYGHARRMARDYEALLHGLWGEKFGGKG